MSLIKISGLIAVYLIAFGMRANAQSDNGISHATTIVVGAPVMSTYLGSECLSGHGESSGVACIGTLTVGPLSTAEILTTIALLKEEVRNVEGDAYNYLAGEDMTAALQELINEFRSRHSELKEAKDKDLVKFIIQNA